jgi:hypothetical protein
MWLISTIRGSIIAHKGRSFIFDSYANRVGKGTRRAFEKTQGIYFRRKLTDLIAAYQDGKIPLAEITASVRGWINHVRYANTAGLRKAVLGKAVLQARR